MENSAVKKAVRNFYGFQLFFSLLLWLPVFYEYQKRAGLSDAQIFSIQSIYYVVFCLLEIPTGVMADRFGYRACCRLGAVTLVATNLLPIFAPSYAGFLAHFVLIALARSFVSGAASAYLFDFLAAHSAGEHYKQIEGNARAYGLVAKVVCWAGIGYLMEWHYTSPYWLTTLAAAISVGYALSLPAFAGEGAKAVRRPVTEGLSAVFRVLAATPVLLALMLQGVAIFVLGRLCQVNLFQPILSAKTFGLGSFGVIMSVMTVFEAIGSGRPGWMRRWMSDLNAVFVLSLGMAACLAIIPFCGKWGTLAALSAFAYVMGLSFPIQRQLMNSAITDSTHRATMLSVESIIDRAANAGAAAFIGGFLQSGRMDLFLILSAGATVVTMAAIYVYLSRPAEAAAPVAEAAA